MKKSKFLWIHYFIALVIILASWEILSYILNLNILPTPIEVFKKLNIIFNKKILIHVLFSLRRIVIGLIIGLILAVPIGILSGYNKNINKILSPLLYFNYPIPKLALLPIIMLFFGLRETSKIIMIVLIIFFPITVNIRDEVRNISPEYYYPLRSIGANTASIIKNIVLPAILPGIFTSLRIGIGTAISVLFFTENYGTQYGMGYFIMDSWMRVNYLEMYCGIVVLSIMGLALFVIIDLLNMIFCKWKR